MAKIQIAMFIDVEISEEDVNSWEALHEGYEIIKSSLKLDKRIGDSYYEGISRIY